MLKYWSITLGLAVCSIMIWACAPALPEISEANAQTSAIPLADLQKGRTLYAQNCSGCHGLAQPSAYKAEAWVKIMHSMGPKTKMNTADQQLVLQYLQTYAQH